MSLHITTANRSQLEAEAIAKNDELFNFLGREAGILKLSTEELRDKITEWIIEGDETHGSIQ
jgi:hypothetical protein